MVDDNVQDKGALSDDAMEFMRANRRAFMITLRKDGSPTAHPMAAFYGGGALYVNVYRTSAKARNLWRDDRVCCVLANPSSQPDFEGAIYKGHARELTLEEVFADRVPEGLAWARNPRTGSQEKPDIPPEDERKIGDTAGRVTRGKRIIWEISPDQFGMVQDVREA